MMNTQSCCFANLPLLLFCCHRRLCLSSLLASVNAIIWCGFETLSRILSHSSADFSQYLKNKIGRLSLALISDNLDNYT